MSGESAGRAIALVSGGLDSATALAIAADMGFQIGAISFRYGQRHSAELAAAERVVAGCRAVVEHRVVDIDLGQLGGSALTDSSLAVPKGRSDAEMASRIPVTYVPARNTVFLSLALAWAEVFGAQDLFIGVNAVDYSGYPDCRPEFIAAFEQLANLATRAATEGGERLRVHAPLIEWSKSEIIRRGMQLGVDYSATVSCYEADDDGAACGECDSCLLRRAGFESAGVPDPTRYRREAGGR